MAKLRKVFISADIEGVEGVVSGMSITRGKMDFPVGRKRLALDVNAAIQAAFDMGINNRPLIIFILLLSELFFYIFQ